MAQASEAVLGASLNTSNAFIGLDEGVLTDEEIPDYVQWRRDKAPRSVGYLERMKEHTVRTGLPVVPFLPLAALVLLSACAESSIQAMSQDTFKVATTAAPACGPNGARNVAFRTAAVEVIRKGGDKFVLVSDTTDTNFWSGSHGQSMIVKMIPENSREARNALSARTQLGSDWQKLVSEGAPVTCA